jgi:hypothetical protein
MKITICICIMAMCWGCLSKTERIKKQYSDNRKEFQQELQTKNFKMITEVFIKPDSVDFKHDKDLIFKTRIMLDKEQLENDKSLSAALQYGIDSAFFLQNEKDIIWPAYVMPVANGQPLNPEFIVAFEREKLSGSNKVEFKAAIRSISTANDSGIVFNLTKINRLYK